MAVRNIPTWNGVKPVYTVNPDSEVEALRKQAQERGCFKHVIYRHKVTFFGVGSKDQKAYAVNWADSTPYWADEILVNGAWQRPE